MMRSSSKTLKKTHKKIKRKHHSKEKKKKQLEESLEISDRKLINLLLNEGEKSSKLTQWNSLKSNTDREKRKPRYKIKIEDWKKSNEERALFFLSRSERAYSNRNQNKNPFIRKKGKNLGFFPQPLKSGNSQKRKISFLHKKKFKIENEYYPKSFMVPKIDSLRVKTFEYPDGVNSERTHNRKNSKKNSEENFKEKVKDFYSSTSKIDQRSKFKETVSTGLGSKNQKRDQSFETKIDQKKEKKEEKSKQKEYKNIVEMIFVKKPIIMKTEGDIPKYNKNFEKEIENEIEEKERIKSKKRRFKLDNLERQTLMDFSTRMKEQFISINKGENLLYGKKRSLKPARMSDYIAKKNIDFFKRKTPKYRRFPQVDERKITAGVFRELFLKEKKLNSVKNLRKLSQGKTMNYGILKLRTKRVSCKVQSNSSHVLEMTKDRKDDQLLRNTFFWKNKRKNDCDDLNEFKKNSSLKLEGMNRKLMSLTDGFKRNSRKLEKGKTFER